MWRRAGFSLVQLLVAIAIGAIVLGLALDAWQKGREKAKSSSEARQEAVASSAANAKDATNSQIPAWYRTRYYDFATVEGPVQHNELLVNLAILSAILALAFSVGHVLIDPNRNYRSDKVQEMFKEAIIIVLAEGALCLVGYLLINLVFGMMNNEGRIPIDFCAFCILIFVDLTLIFFAVTYMLRKQQGQLQFEGTSKTLALSLGKAFVVAILSGVASYIGGYIGGVVALGILAVIGAAVNPSSA